MDPRILLTYAEVSEGGHGFPESIEQNELTPKGE